MAQPSAQRCKITISFPVGVGQVPAKNSKGSQKLAFDMIDTFLSKIWIHTTFAELNEQKKVFLSQKNAPTYNST